MKICWVTKEIVLTLEILCSNQKNFSWHQKHIFIILSPDLICGYYVGNLDFEDLIV